MATPRLITAAEVEAGEQGDVQGPDTAEDGNIALFDGTTGKLLKAAGVVEGVATIDATTNILIGDDAGNAVDSGKSIDDIGGGAATLELTSNGDVNDSSTFNADNSGIAQKDVNDVTMFTLWSDGTFGGNILIVDKLPSGLEFGSASDNVMIGTQIGQNFTNGGANVGIGNSVFQEITEGSSNTAVGTSAGVSTTDGNENVFIGSSAIAIEPSASNITVIGASATAESGVTANAIAIGSGANVTADNTAVIGNQDITDVAFGAGNVFATSGLLVVGREYTIVFYGAGDDFSNIGCPDNNSGITFTATGTTPADWTHGSGLSSVTTGDAILHAKGDAIVFPDSDPLVAGAAYWVDGVLTRSAGP